MFGGTAKTYANWILIGEPFEEGNKLYIYVKKDETSKQKKVRWYFDKVHDELMPNKKHKVPLYKVFGFEDTEDYIFCIRDIDITEEEFQKYFSLQAWKNGGKWLGNGMFGGVRYAPKDTEIPPLKNIDKVFRINWSDFKKEGQRLAKENGFLNSDWFKED